MCLTRTLLFGTFLIIFHFCLESKSQSSTSTFCPAEGQLETEADSALRVLHLDESNGRKVRLTFFYPPKPDSGNQRSNEDTSSSGESLPEFTTTMVPLPDLNLENETEAAGPDLLCQWEFKVCTFADTYIEQDDSWNRYPCRDIP
jgi:hypothetical protein